jgi:hypothetical protein
MAEPSKTVSESEPLDLGLIDPIVKQVEIKGIILVQAHVLRTPSVNLSEDGLTLDFSVLSLEYGTNPEQNCFFAQPTFLLCPLKDGVREDEPRLLITASFVLTYALKSFDGIEDRNIEAFAQINAIHNAWPYWREFVQSTTARMGIPTVIVPVHRVL